MNSSDTSKKIKIPVEIIAQFENELEGIQHGSGKLEIIFRDGQLQRFTVTRETSHLSKNN